MIVESYFYGFAIRRMKIVAAIVAMAISLLVVANMRAAADTVAQAELSPTAEYSLVQF